MLFLCNRKFRWNSLLHKKAPESAVREEEYIAVLSARARKCALSAHFVVVENDNEVVYHIE